MANGTGLQEARRETSSPRQSATRVAVSVLGLLTAFAGIEHGIGEVRQGAASPDALVIESWPDVEAFELLGGEPAMTVVPNLAVTGVLAIAVATALGAWALLFVHRRHGGAVLVALSGLLLLVGGGFGPPMIGAIAGTVATRIGRDPTDAGGALTRAMAAVWPWTLVLCVGGYLSLVPGVVLLSHLTGFANAYVVSALIALSFGALILSLVSARAHDHLAAHGATEVSRRPKANVPHGANGAKEASSC